MQRMGKSLAGALLCVSLLIGLAPGALAAPKPVIRAVWLMPIDGGVQLMGEMRSAPKDVRYKWQIRGEKQWEAIPDSNDLSFEYLEMEDGQSYQFRLVAQNEEGRANSDTLRFAYSAAQDAAFPATAHIAGKSTAVYRTASLQGKKLGTLKEEEVINVLGFEKAFALISWDEKNEDDETASAGPGFAYVSGNYINLTLDPALIGVVGKKCDVFSAKNAKKESRAGTLNKGEEIPLLAREGAWWRSELAGEAIYIQADRISIK